MFLTGLADFYIDYEVVRTLAYGFEIDTFTLGEFAAACLDRALSMADSVISFIF